MKRGKRQIQQRPNIFQSDQQPQSNQQSAFNFSSQLPSNSNSSTFPVLSQPIESREAVNKNNNESGSSYSKINNHNSQHNIDVDKRSSNVEESKQVLGADDERKKRLEMLRQKYLKTGPSSTVPQKQQEPKKEKETFPEISYQQNFKKQEKKANKKQIQQPVSENKDQKEENQSHEQNTKEENESPISKPAAQSQTNRINRQFDEQVVVQPRRPVPPPPTSSKRGKAPPPKPIAVRSQIIQSSYPRQQNLSDQNQQTMTSNKVQLSQMPRQQNLSQIQIPKPQRQVPKKRQVATVAKQNIQQLKLSKDESVQNIDELIISWLNGTVDKHENVDIESQLQSICQQIATDNLKLAQFIRFFVVHNQVQLSNQQKSFVKNLVDQSQNLSNFGRLFFSLKCGSSPTVNELSLNNIAPFKSYFLPQELSTFVNSFLSNQPTQTDLPFLTHLDPKNHTLISNINSHQFVDAKNIVKILAYLRNNVDESVCVVYFKLINLLIGHVENGQILERILSLVNEIGFQSAYQMKKEIKLKIIQKIDRCSTNSSSYSETMNKQKDDWRETQNHHNIETNRTQKEGEKGSGMINIIGYVNQAFKKITSQIPEKTQQTKSNSSGIVEEKQSIQWDPVLNRYLINGKIPDDQYGKPTTNDTSQKQKKKPPPPPPRPTKKSSKQGTPQLIKQDVEQDFAKQVEQQHQNNNLQVENGQQSREVMTPPPPPRMGLKGLNNKKPKIQVRYA